MRKKEGSCLILHIPHSSTYIPREEQERISIPNLHRELLRMTDRFTHELFSGTYSSLVFPVSRLVCDPERFRDDESEPMAQRGMGAVYTTTSDGVRFREFSREVRERILRTYYDPHHAALTEMTAEKLQETGRCLIVDGHSFSSVPLPHEPDRHLPRPDFCIGTDPFHTPPALFDTAKRFLTGEGFSVAENTPFSGTLVPMEYYRKEAGVHSIMIEINRGLYMTEDGERNHDFGRIRDTVRALLDVFSAWEDRPEAE